MGQFISVLAKRMGIMVLIGFLTACQIGQPLPNQDLVQKAIALQSSLIQPELSRQLHLNEKNMGEFQIHRLQITQQTPLTIQRLPAFRMQGTYDLVFKLGSHAIKCPQSSFDLYIQLQSEAKTWKLLRPNVQGWFSYFIE